MSSPHLVQLRHHAAELEWESYNFDGVRIVSADPWHSSDGWQWIRFFDGPNGEEGEFRVRFPRANSDPASPEALEPRTVEAVLNGRRIGCRLPLRTGRHSTVIAGLSCVLRRPSAKGWWCGYAAIPSTHPLYGMSETQASRELGLLVTWADTRPGGAITGDGRWWIGIDLAFDRDAPASRMMSEIATLACRLARMAPENLRRWQVTITARDDAGRTVGAGTCQISAFDEAASIDAAHARVRRTIPSGAEFVMKTREIPLRGAYLDSLGLTDSDVELATAWPAALRKLHELASKSLVGRERGDDRLPLALDTLRGVAEAYADWIGNPDQFRLPTMALAWPDPLVGDVLPLDPGQPSHALRICVAAAERALHLPEYAEYDAEAMRAYTIARRAIDLARDFIGLHGAVLDQVEREAVPALDEAVGMEP